MFERGAREAEAEVTRLVEALRHTRRGALKAILARWAARRMRALIGLRETPKLTLMRVFGPLHDALLADGADLAAEGLLAQADDVFYLHLAELEDLARERSNVRKVSGPYVGLPAASRVCELVASRREAATRELRRRQIPRVLLSDGQAFYNSTPPASPEGMDALQGDPVSPGVVEGIVHVVLDPRSTQLASGEILVCPGTDPSWTPLFLAAGGLVMEVGGMMTHGAVVAREYGLPAVVGVDQATERLHTGQRVRVDGSTGLVTLLTADS